MIDWPRVARRLGFADEVEMFTVLYTNSRVSLRALAERFGITEGVLKVALNNAGLRRRGRGGPNNLRYEILSSSKCTELRAEGVATAAKRLGFSYNDLYYRIRVSERFHTRSTESFASAVEDSSDDGEDLD